MKDLLNLDHTPIEAVLARVPGSGILQAALREKAPVPLVAQGVIGPREFVHIGVEAIAEIFRGRDPLTYQVLDLEPPPARLSLLYAIPEFARSYREPANFSMEVYESLDKFIESEQKALSI